MPYIPPPRPPPAPRPPVFRPPPGPSIHQQQMRFQQQHQQQFRQQQQIRQFHQTQQQLLANQTRMQMDRNRQQQMLHQQQLHRQQQENFRRQQQLHQDNLRRQQQLHQDQFRRQQQFHQNHQEQLRRQQQLLQGLQTNSESTGSSVFISPAFSFEISGLSPVQVTAQGVGGGEAAVDSGALPPQQAPPLPTAPPPNPQGEDFYPPPYSTASLSSSFAQTQSLPLQSAPELQPLPPKLDVSLPPPQLNGGPGFEGSPPPKTTPITPQKAPRQPKKHEIALKDGTTITIKSKNEYLFVGPKGQQMVVNCLPLFLPRPDTQGVNAATGSLPGDEGETEEKQDVHSLMHEPRKQERRATKAMRRFVLKKASSAENLLNTSNATTKAPKSDQKKWSSEAEDILDANTKKSVKVQRNMWTHFNSSCPATGGADKVAESASTPPVAPAELPKKDKSAAGTDEGEGEVGVGEESKEVDGTDGEVNEESGANASQALSDGGSDGDESKEMKVSYIDNPEQVQTLKRSSGSVSFIGTATPLRVSVRSSPRPPSVAEDVNEEKEGEAEGASTAAFMGSDSGVKVVLESGVTLLGSGGRDDTDGKGEKTPPTVESEEKKNESKSEGDDQKPKLEANEVELGAQPQTAPGEVSEKAQLAQATSVSPTAPPQVPPDLVPFTSAPPDLVPFTSAPPDLVPLTSAPLDLGTEGVVPTALPPIPMTFEPEFLERSGWLMKLSHRRGVFGDKWQKRYFVLHGSWIYYFKKYGDSIPRGAIRLHPGAWAKPIPQGTTRQSDAVTKNPPNAIISVVRCFGVHRPDNFAYSLTSLLSQEGVADVFKSQTISVSNSDSCSRTFYMIAPSNEERCAWVDAIQNNIRAHALSDSAMETSCNELRNMLRAIQSFPPSGDLSPLLSLLHTRTKELFGRHSNKEQ